MSAEKNQDVTKDLTKIAPINDESAYLQKQLIEMQLEIAKAQLEELKLTKTEKSLHIQELRSTIADRETKQRQAQMDRESQGRTFAQSAAADRQRQAMCTHKKGGIVSARNIQALQTGGNGAQYAVIKHQMINGDMWVRCQRCAKTWSPPLKINFFFRPDERGVLIAVAPQDGTFNQGLFDQAVREYDEAKRFNTNNTPSASVQCRFSKWVKGADGQWFEADASDDYRQTLASTNLR
jgi:hypothetical protein